MRAGRAYWAASCLRIVWTIFSSRSRRRWQEGWPNVEGPVWLRVLHLRLLSLRGYPCSVSNRREAISTSIIGGTDKTNSRDERRRAISTELANRGFGDAHGWFLSAIPHHIRPGANLTCRGSRHNRWEAPAHEGPKGVVGREERGGLRPASTAPGGPGM